MLEELNFAYEKPQASALFKQQPEDFIVTEMLPFTPSQEGEHHYFFIEKKGLNTEELITDLAKTLSISSSLISYAGLKDKHAVTRQWLSVHLPGKTIDQAANLVGNGWRVLNFARHIKKLKIGVLSGNHFQITLKQITHPKDLEQRLLLIKQKGIPNYFGPQRFGNEGQNLIKAEQLLLKGQKVKNRFLKGIYYSAARAFLFNLLLSERIKQGNWNQALEGEVVQLSGSHSIFTVDTPDSIIEERIKNFDISPAGVLWGKGKLRVSEKALEVLENAFIPYQNWCAALSEHRLELAYRAFIAEAKDLQWTWVKEDEVILNFTLGPGNFATSVLRELVNF